MHLGRHEGGHTTKAAEHQAVRQRHDFSERTRISERSARFEGVSARTSRLQQGFGLCKGAIASYFGGYNFVPRHAPGTTPAAAARVELKPWRLGEGGEIEIRAGYVGEMAAASVRRKEGAKFEAAFAKLDC